MGTIRKCREVNGKEECVNVKVQPQGVPDAVDVDDERTMKKKMKKANTYEQRKKMRQLGKDPDEMNVKSLAHHHHKSHKHEFEDLE